MQITQFVSNPYSWVPSAKDINSQVIEIDFKTSPDADPTVVKGLSEPVAISIPMNSKVLLVYNYIF